MHVIHFANPAEKPWLLSLKGEIPEDATLAPSWEWAMDSRDGGVGWENDRVLYGWGWSTPADAVDVLTLLNRERERWDDGLFVL